LPRPAPGEEAAAEVGVRPLVAGSEKGLTLADNQAAFDELGFAPHVVVGHRPATSPLGHGSVDLDAGVDLADGRAGRAPRR